MTEDELISNFKKIGITLEKSLTTLDRTNTVLEFFEGCCISEFDLEDDEKKIFLNATHKIKKALEHVMNEVEDAENQISSLCSIVTSEKSLIYSIVIDSLDQVMKHE